MGIKIQINSLEALERLLGGDDELEIEVRKSVIEAFGKGFVKSAANAREIAAEISETRKMALEAIQKEAERSFGLVREKTYPYTARLSPGLTERIRSAVVSELHDEIQNQVRAARDQIAEIVEAQVRRTVEASVKAATSQEFQQRVREAVSKLTF